MKKGLVIEDIWFRDNKNSDTLIDVLFKTSEGNFLYSDFKIESYMQPVDKGWALFEKFKSTVKGSARVTNIKIEYDLSLIIELEAGNYIYVYFVPSNIHIQSDHILDIFTTNELSKDFLEAFEHLDDK